MYRWHILGFLSELSWDRGEWVQVDGAGCELLVVEAGGGMWGSFCSSLYCGRHVKFPLKNFWSLSNASLTLGLTTLNFNQKSQEPF